MAKSIIFTNNALKKMKDIGLSESKVIEVYSTGEDRKYGDSKIKQKKYLGYEIGVIYSFDKVNSQPIIVSVWQRTNRR